MVTIMLGRADAGTKEWWREIADHGTPWVEKDRDGRYRVTFLWRDPGGNAQTSALRRVWLNINGITDHHQSLAPQSLERLPGTDVWYRQTCLSATWRGSYCFIPREDDTPFPAAAGSRPETEMSAWRLWWGGLLDSAVHDSLNPLRCWVGARGHGLSPLHMPLAPPQTAWTDVDRRGADSRALRPPSPARLECRRWHSRRLGNSRDVWVLTTGQQQPHRRPLAILLDGRFWSQEMPVAVPLSRLTREGRLPEAVYVMIDSVDTRQRSHELTCNAEFWLAVREELMPWLGTWAPYRPDPATTVVAGQSFGGLAAMYAALHWPLSFGLVLSQSGSFWWPHRDPGRIDGDTRASGELLRQLEDGLGAGLALGMYIEAGIHEPLIYQANERLLALLRPSRHRLRFRRVDGGHDALCWRGGLLDGLESLWRGPDTQTTV
ncbi:enterochelin esterase [Sodalis sp. RH16]|uniref:enterochelin esterase n=1 Tax=Sodalis sp. RH16 TaxID=3394331 RepID=UPI0039B6CA43